MLNRRNLRISVVLVLCLAAGSAANAQANLGASSTKTAPVPQATYMAGLNNMKTGAKGNLRIAKRSVYFESGSVKSSLPLDEITAVYTGDERAEKGGTAGEIVRKLPYGAGHVAGAAMQTSVDLLTLQYQDQSGGLHGAIFILPKDDAETFKDHINPRPVRSSQAARKECNAEQVPQKSILVDPIEVQGVDVPAEYRLLIYERLVADLQQKLIDYAIYRSGDAASGPGCIAETLHLTVTDFAKGNEAERGTAGVLGLFVGATSMSYRLSLETSHGAALLDEPLKGSRRGDHESLTLADGVAKKVSQKVVKALREAKDSDGKQS